MALFSNVAETAWTESHAWERGIAIGMFVFEQGALPQAHVKIKK